MSSLFVYGTLGPGCPNAHILENIGGQWAEGWVNGTLHNQGWGADLGYPGIVLDESTNQVQGFVFSSEHLNANWKLLDDFEGEEYERVPVQVTLNSGERVDSFIYVLKS
ncbi:gamma-glutamylcyclotransferase family protein [Acinetobacter oleivorans]|uniref:gamma-glutamylcyclotransferase family protein n=1 Tax=Acinetobacter oleivorans TaxID=1148157 RepID=UPI003A8816D7